MLLVSSHFITYLIGQMRTNDSQTTGESGPEHGETKSMNRNVCAQANLTPIKTQSSASIQADGVPVDETSRLQKLFDDYLKSEPVRHDRVFVLLLTWDDDIDELKVKTEVR